MELRSRRRDGFTLVELLVVLAIVALLATASTISMGSMMASMRLNQCIDLVQGILTVGRRTAISHSHIVEIRFFQCTDPSSPGSTTQWRALQAVEILESGVELPVGKALILPYRGMMSGSTSASPLIFDTALQYAGTPPSNLGTVANYRRFRFMPDGSTDLALLDSAQANWYFTIYSENDISRGDPPRNYATIQVEPFTGAISTTRP